MQINDGFVPKYIRKSKNETTNLSQEGSVPKTELNGNFGKTTHKNKIFKIMIVLTDKEVTQSCRKPKT